MRTLRTTLPLAAALAAALSGCVAGIDGGGDGGDDGGDDGVVTPPPLPPPPPVTDPPVQSVAYRRGSLPPLYQLTPRGEFQKFTQKGVTMNSADFEDNGNDFVSSRDKIAEIEGVISAELGQPVTIFPDTDNENRARRIPFRGNPSDVKLFKQGNIRKAFVPLGGDVMTPGNEVAAVNLVNGAVQRIKVGIRPQRVAVAGGLVFVANQFSNYVSIIDPETDELLTDSNNQPVEIKTEFYGTDILLVPQNIQVNDGENFWLYIANNWRGSVLKYGIRIVRSGINDDIETVIVTDPVAPSPDNQPAAEITGVGRNPYRLTLSQDQRSVYVANNRGGELGQITIATGATVRTVFTSHTGDVVQINDKIFIPTGPKDRGLPARGEALPTIATAQAVTVRGADGQDHVAHPGAQFDETLAYNFEDVRNGLYQLNANINADVNRNDVIYFTDDTTPEENFDDATKILAGASAQGIVVNAARNKVFVAHSGSDLVQELAVRGGTFRLADIANAEYATEERPFAIALDEENDQLLVANWGGETLEIFSLQNRQRQQRIDLGYAIADYPATNMERGEYFFYNADWSNNGDKACAVGCHWDELLADGIPFANGATAPTAYHKVIPNFNQASSDSFFWNGSFKNGSYASLASDAQTRSNCELILFGLTEGPSSDPNLRIGDPANRVTTGAADDALCRPNTAGGGVLPQDFDTILAVIARQKVVRNQVVIDETGLPFDDVTRLTDFYSASELRLPPNPVAFLKAQAQLASDVSAKIDRGAALFASAGCGNCHSPTGTKAPFTDLKEHGRGADWRERFEAEYDDDPLLLSILPDGVPDIMKDAYSGSTPDDEINIHLDPIDYFVPFCFDNTECLMFEDPLAAKGNDALEDDRLNALVLVNLANADRQFIPGNVRGQPMVNTPSLRGHWWQGNFLRHGLANSVAEAILPPGSTALPDGARGYAIDRFGKIDVHGRTSTMSADDVDALRLYLTSIE